MTFLNLLQTLNNISINLIIVINLITEIFQMLLCRRHRIPWSSYEKKYLRTPQERCPSLSRNKNSSNYIENKIVCFFE